MEVEELIKQAEENIQQALEDYEAHTYQTEVLEDVEDVFIQQLAEDSTYAKQELRELFSKSPVWHPELDALIINGTRTHDPDYQRIGTLARKILHKPIVQAADGGDYSRYDMMLDAIDFFTIPDDVEAQERGIAAINILAPKAYRPGKKKSRVFKALCIALGVADESAGSEFQRLYAQFADELSSRKIGFKLFVSINPAHFLTMSNPKADERGSTLTSCHSLNSTEYEYNCGCCGYARDEVSFIVFTAADPDDPASLNNRKTTRQIFAYRPGNGVLLQSRMYDTSGGTKGQVEDSKLYRDLIQREISALENQPNLWKTFDSCENRVSKLVKADRDFGGYCDWEHSTFGGKICVRAEKIDSDGTFNCEPLTIGTSGLCVVCGDETNYGMYCDSCRRERYEYHCDDCDYGSDDEDEFSLVYDAEGQDRYVCEQCRDANYTSCDRCGRYHANSVMERVDGLDICPSCLDAFYMCCEDCGDYCSIEDHYTVRDADGEEIEVCEFCFRHHYDRCEECGEYVDSDSLTELEDDETGCLYSVCDKCFNNYHDEAETEIAREAV